MSASPPLNAPPTHAHAQGMLEHVHWASGVLASKARRRPERGAVRLLEGSLEWGFGIGGFAKHNKANENTPWNHHAKWNPMFAEENGHSRGHAIHFHDNSRECHWAAWYFFRDSETPESSAIGHSKDFGASSRAGSGASSRAGSGAGAGCGAGTGAGSSASSRQHFRSFRAERSSKSPS